MMLREYWNVASKNGLEKRNSDITEVFECSKCERTRETELLYLGSIGM